MVKGPKSLNPSDKARKEARKKELKKNKKQRQQVRSAAIEKKDPEQVISDLEKLDEFEFDVTTNPSMNDSFYKEKRKRLMESWGKILAYYLKVDPERHSKLAKLESEYEAKHKRLAREFEAIKAAKELKIEDVFLPPEPTSAIDEIADDDSLLSESVYVTPVTENVNPPGCPPGLPPDLKQLAESLSTQNLSIPLEPLPLPSNLINLRLPQQAMIEASSNRALHPPYRNNKFRPDSERNRQLGQQDYRHLRHPNQQIRKPETTAINQDVTSTIKAAAGPIPKTVIESKPVIFKPRTTKFVPSSVRTKLSKKDTNN